MKEITRIHLAATAFNIDITAKKELEKYLEAIEKSLHADEDTLREIESRIVELLAERGVSGERVVTLGDVEVIEQQLGSPADFTDQDHIEKDDTITQKRLLRDDQKGLIGGVSAGIGAYFGVNPNWIRLIAIALTFVSFGTAVLVYVVLWLALPAAKTTAEKLQMSGKPVTLAALKESSLAGPIEPRTKPLLTVIRIVVGLGFVAAAIIPVGMLVFGIGVGVTEFSANQDLINGWLVAAFALLVVSGVLFTLLMLMAAYSIFAWRFTKRIAIGGIAVIVAGMVLSATAFGLGIYGSSQASQKVASLTKTTTTNVAQQFNGATGIVTDAKSLGFVYEQTDGEPRIELTTTDRGSGRPSVEVIREGDIVRLMVTGDEDTKNCFIPSGCGYGTTRAVVYGPALQSIDVEGGDVMYDASTQNDLAVTVKNSASLSINDTAIMNLNAVVDQNGSLSTIGASIENVALRTMSGGSVSMGVVSMFDFTPATSCPAGSKTEISIEQVTTLKQAGQDIPKQSEIDTNCAELTIDALNDDTNRL